MAIIEVIKYEGGNNVFVWKHPKEDFNTSAQLIVHESQEAYIYRDGQLSEPYKARKHTIQTENIPGIRRIVGLVTGGISPNHYEVYYINKSVSMDVFWGTASPWVMQDPSLQIPFKMQAHGQFSVLVQDPRKLLLKLVGTTTSFTQRTLQNYFSGIMISRIKDHISNLIVSEGLSYTELSTKLVAISEKVAPHVANTLEKYGLTLEEFAVESINIKEDEISEAVREAQKDRAVNIIKGLTEQEKMSYEVAKTQAANPGAGGQVAQVMTGLAAGAAIGPAVGGYVRNIMQPSEVSGQKMQPQRDQFSMGVVSKRQQENNSNEENNITCPDCGAKLAVGSRFCNQCGSEIKVNTKPETISCPVCGAALPTGSKFCNICGTKL